jgi:hypothetical protein
MNPALETLLWTVGGGALAGTSSYLQGLSAGAVIDWSRIETACVIGAVTAALALFRTPPGTPPPPTKQ